MRWITRPLAIAAGCALATAAFSGAALAGNGNDNAPGQQKKDEAAQTEAAQTEAAQTNAQVRASAAAHAQAQSSASQSPSDEAPGQAKKSDVSASAGASASADARAGVKPSSTTTKWTHCRTGGLGTATVLCTAQAGTPAAKADVSKLYGNGQTAAQIAVGRGAPDGTLITGPGNSQPHKVTACGKPSNKSGGVDVHAVKSYDASACAATQPAVTQVQAAVVATTPVVKSPVTATATTTPPATVGAVNNAPTTQSSPSASPSQNAGGVLGTSSTIVKPKAKGGVLGAVSSPAGSTLPFTGFPVWVALLVGLGLIAAGLTLRHRGSTVTRV
jgi:hypothetical protein